MKSVVSSIFILGLLASIAQAQFLGISYGNRENDVLGKFVNSRMKNGFRKWFTSKIFDEDVGFQPPLQVGGSNRLMALTGEMREVRTTGGVLSNLMTFVSGNILEGSLYLDVTYNPEEIQGKYNLNGTILNGVPVSGKGFFWVTKPPTVYSILNFTDLCIAPEGHIDLSCAHLDNRTQSFYSYAISQPNRMI